MSDGFVFIVRFILVGFRRFGSFSVWFRLVVGFVFIFF